MITTAWLQKFARLSRRHLVWKASCSKGILSKSYWRPETDTYSTGSIDSTNSALIRSSQTRSNAITVRLPWADFLWLFRLPAAFQIWTVLDAQFTVRNFLDAQCLISQFLMLTAWCAWLTRPSLHCQLSLVSRRVRVVAWKSELRYNSIF